MVNVLIAIDDGMILRGSLASFKVSMRFFHTESLSIAGGNKAIENSIQ